MIATQLNNCSLFSHIYLLIGEGIVLSFAKKITLIHLLLLVIVFPVLMRIFWGFADPLLANISPRIPDYGSIKEIPDIYIGKWNGWRGNAVVKQTTITTKEDGESTKCRVKSKEREYGYNNSWYRYGRFHDWIAFYLYYFPPSLFGSERIIVK